MAMANIENTIVPETKTGTYLDEPPAYDFTEISSTDQKEIIAEARSIASSASSNTDLSHIPSNFNVTKTLLVNARGIRLIRFPIPSGELEIPITSSTGDLVYLSTRQKRCSGNATLSDATGKELLASEYQFGPGREPKLHILERGDAEDATIITKGKWTSRAQEFVLPDERTFTWRYVRELHSLSSKETLEKPKKRTFLVLEAPLGIDANPIDKGKKKAEKRRLAKLVRDEEARTPGTRSSDAGNGGELKLDGEAILAAGLRQDIVVATLLMMLKKEVDRRRIIQFMVIAAAVSG